MGGQVANSGTPMPNAPASGGSKGPASPMASTPSPGNTGKYSQMFSSQGNTGDYSQMFSSASPLSSGGSSFTQSIPTGFSSASQQLAAAPPEENPMQSFVQQAYQQESAGGF